MKKLIVALAFFATAGAVAQSKPAKVQGSAVEASSNLSDDAKASKSVADISAVVTLTDAQKVNFKQLFLTKYRMLTESGQELSAERKEYIANIIDKKLEASLDGASYEKVKANTALHHSLTH